MIEINNMLMADPSSFQVGIMDISKAERNARGEMLIDRVATKVKLELEWKQLSTENMSKLLNAVKSVYFQVKYPDPLAGRLVIKIFYVGDRTAPMYNNNSGKPIWSNLKMNFVEK